MFKIIAIMGLGVLIGLLVRCYRWVKYISTSTMVTILLLLLVMGFEIGGNPTVMGNLASLGGEALLISVAAILGSITCARIIYMLFFKNREPNGR